MLMVFRNSHGEFHRQHALDYYFLFSQFLKSTCRSTKSETQTTQAEEDDLRNEAAGDYQALWIRLNAEVKNDLRNDRFQRRCCVIDRRQRKEMMISWDRRQRKQKRLGGSFGSNTEKRELDTDDDVIVLNIEIPVFLARFCADFLRVLYFREWAKSGNLDHIFANLLEML
jgi:hypothetical protein